MEAKVKKERWRRMVKIGSKWQIHFGEKSGYAGHTVR